MKYVKHDMDPAPMVVIDKIFVRRASAAANTRRARYEIVIRIVVT